MCLLLLEGTCPDGLVCPTRRVWLRIEIFPVGLTTSLADVEPNHTPSVRNERICARLEWHGTDILSTFVPIVVVTVEHAETELAPMVTMCDVCDARSIA